MLLKRKQSTCNDIVKQRTDQPLHLVSSWSQPKMGSRKCTAFNLPSRVYLMTLSVARWNRIRSRGLD